MPRKFVYGPGLPGYGTKGVDGSTGLLGLATYFSAYDGNSDSVTIKSKIIANKELFSTDDLLPGYPARTYQSGDIFIDKNARVFQIDFATSNLYVDTGIFLNTSGFFTELGTQTLSPQFTRYSNAYLTEKFLIDVVYSNDVGDYTSYPTSIYDNTPNYFAQVKYVDQALVTNFNGWYPFEIWTTGIVGSDDAIALVREEDNNSWHFGNADGGVIKDVSLYLDFGDIYSDGVYHGAIDGTISTTNLSVPGWVNVGGDTSLGSDLFVNGDLQFNSGVSRNIDVQDVASGTGWNMNLRGGGSASGAGGNLYLGGGVGTTSTGGIFLNMDGITDLDLTTDWVLHMSTSTTGNRRIYRGQLPVQNVYDVATSTEYPLVTGYSSDPVLNRAPGISFRDSGNYDTLKLQADNESGTGTQAPRKWGSLTVGTAGTSPGAQGHTLNLVGGDAIDNTSGGGAEGGDIYARGGTGGSQTLSLPAYLDAGGPGSLSLGSGGGWQDLSIDYGGIGGEVELKAGVGGDASTGSTAGGGDAGDLIIKTDRGGLSRVWYGGDGGDISITAGAGGNSTSGTDGDGGNIVIKGAGWPSRGGGDITLETDQCTFPADIVFTLFAANPGDIVMNNLPTSGVATTQYLGIDGNNHVYRSSSAPSDIKYKTIVSDVSSALDGILTLGVYNFNWNQRSLEYFDKVDLKENQIGLIAQEVEQVFPDLVKEAEIMDKEVNFKTVLYEKLPIILTQALKEQHYYIQELEAKVSSLESEVEAIKTHLGI